MREKNDFHPILELSMTIYCGRPELLIKISQPDQKFSAGSKIETKSAKKRQLITLFFAFTILNQQIDKKMDFEQD